MVWTSSTNKRVGEQLTKVMKAKTEGRRGRGYPKWMLLQRKAEEEWEK